VTPPAAIAPVLMSLLVAALALAAPTARAMDYRINTARSVAEVGVGQLWVANHHRTLYPDYR
jgi:hypothetical protein